MAGAVEGLNGCGKACIGCGCFIMLAMIVFPIIAILIGAIVSG